MDDDLVSLVIALKPQGGSCMGRVHVPVEIISRSHAFCSDFRMFLRRMWVKNSPSPRIYAKMSSFPNPLF